MRFAFRTLVPVFAAAVVVSATTASSHTASAQDAAKTAAAPAKDAAPAAAAPAADASAAAAPSDAADPQPLLAKGEAALKAGDFTAAVAAFNDAGNAAQQASQAGGGTDALKFQSAALVGRARAEIGLRDFDAADKDFKSVLGDNPNDLSALIGFGQLKLETSKPDEAVDQFRNATKINPASGEAQFGLGKSLVLLGQGDDALQALNHAITIDPKNAEAYRLRGTAYASTYKNKQAFEDVKKAIELNPEDYESYFSLAVLDMRAEDYKDAVDQYGKAIEHYKPKPGREDQPFFEGYLGRTTAFLELGKKAAKDSPEQKAAYQASFDEVQKLIKQLDEKNPAHYKILAATLSSRGIAERMLGQLGPAIRTLTHAIELQNQSSPDDRTAPFLADTYFRRGICFHLIGEDKMAISDFETSAHLDVTDPRASLWEGFTQAKLGDYQQALRAYGDAIAASDRYTPAYYNRGLAYMMMGNYKKAIIDFNDAIRLDPSNAEYYFKRGLAYEQEGDHQKASESYSAAIEFDKNHAGAHRHMAGALQKLGRSELATQYRQKADQLAPAKKNAQ